VAERSPFFLGGLLSLFFFFFPPRCWRASWTRKLDQALLFFFFPFLPSLSRFFLFSRGLCRMEYCNRGPGDLFFFFFSWMSFLFSLRSASGMENPLAFPLFFLLSDPSPPLFLFLPTRRRRGRSVSMPVPPFLAAPPALFLFPSVQAGREGWRRRTAPLLLLRLSPPFLFSPFGRRKVSRVRFSS